MTVRNTNNSAAASTAATISKRSTSFSERLKNLGDFKSYNVLGSGGGQGGGQGRQGGGGGRVVVTPKATATRIRHTTTASRSSLFNKSSITANTIKTSLARDDFLFFELYQEEEIFEDVHDNDIDIDDDDKIEGGGGIRFTVGTAEEKSTTNKQNKPNYTITYHNWTLRQLYRHVVSSIKDKGHQHHHHHNNSNINNTPSDIKTTARTSSVSFGIGDVADANVDAFAAAVEEESFTIGPSSSFSPSMMNKNINNDVNYNKNNRRQHHRKTLSMSAAAFGTATGIAAGHHNHNLLLPQKLLGSNLHPRDMRRLVTPFSASNEPELIIRRHVMVFNFDPLRAIITRNRLIVLVPDGADSILRSLEERIVVGDGQNNMDDYYYDDDDDDNNNSNYNNDTNSIIENDVEKLNVNSNDDVDIDDHDHDGDRDDNWSDIMIGMDGIDQQQDLTFELLCVNACLATVFEMLADDTEELQEKGLKYVQNKIINNSMGNSNPEDALAVIRNLKNAVTVMQARVKGFVQSITRILNEDEDMALMNVSRLITHPQNFIQPISTELLEIESDEPELVLESNLNNALTLSNALELIQGQVSTASDLIDARMDAARNKFLLASLVMSIASLSLTVLTCVGGIFGMNVPSGLEEVSDPPVFIIVTVASCFGSLFTGIAIFGVMVKTGVITGLGPVDKEGIDSLF